MASASQVAPRRSRVASAKIVPEKGRGRGICCPLVSVVGAVRRQLWKSTVAFPLAAASPGHMVGRRGASRRRVRSFATMDRKKKKKVSERAFKSPPTTSIQSSVRPDWLPALEAKPPPPINQGD